MLEHLKQDARFARLEAPVFEWNPASMRVLEKLGFEREAVSARVSPRTGSSSTACSTRYLIKP